MKKLLYLATFVSIVGSLSLDAAQRDLTVKYTTAELRVPDAEKFYTHSIPSGEPITMSTIYTEQFYIRISSDEPIEALQQWGNYYHAWIQGNTQGTMKLTTFPLKDLSLEIEVPSYDVNDQPFAEELVMLLHNNYVSMFNEQTFYDIQPGTWQDDLSNLVIQKTQQVLEEQYQLIAALHRCRWEALSPLSSEDQAEYQRLSAEAEEKWAALSPDEQEGLLNAFFEEYRTDNTLPAQTWLGKQWEKVKKFFGAFEF